MIVLDTLLTLLADENQGGSGAIWAIQKAVKALHSLPPGENVAIYATGYKLWVVREFTQDRESLEQKLRKWKPAMDVHSGGTQNRCAAPGNRADRRACRRHPGTEESNLGRVPVSDRSARGAKAQGCGCRGLSSGCAWFRDRAEERKQFANLPLRALAAATGGVAYFDRDDLDVAIREAIDDGRSNYTLGFYPSGDDRAFANSPGRRTRHAPWRHAAIPEQLPDGAAAQARARKGGRSGASHVQPRGRLGHPYSSLGQANPSSGEPNSDQSQIQGNQERLSFDAVLDAASLDLAPAQNRWTGKLEVVAQFMAADGSTVGDRPALAQTVNLNFSQPTYDGATQRGLLYHNELKIPAKAVEFKILIANMATGKIGTVTIPLSEVEPAKRF